MADTGDMDRYNEDQRGAEDDRDYGRERSRSPGPDRDGDTRIRDQPQNGRGDRDHGGDRRGGEEEGATNSGSNLFVTGIHPKLSEDEVKTLFGQYGAVEKCNIMKDPHTRESRGFGFVKMMTAAEADAAKEALQGEVHEGRTLSIEKARRSRPRTPTPGKYFGPPKRGPPLRFSDSHRYGSHPPAMLTYYEDDRPSRGGYRDRYDDRGYSRRDDRYGDRRGGGYRDRYDDRGYGGGRRDDYRGGDRYGSYRGGDDRYSDRRGGGYDSYERAPRGPPPDAAGYSGTARDAPPARDYTERRRDYD